MALHLNDTEAKGELRVSIVMYKHTGDLASLLSTGLTEAEWHHPKLAFTSVPTWCIPTLQAQLAARDRPAESDPRYTVHARLWTLAEAGDDDKAGGGGGGNQSTGTAERCAPGTPPRDGEAPPEPPTPTSKVEASVGFLLEDEAAIVNEHWSHRWDGSEAVVRACIRDRPSACLRLAQGGDPVAWAIVRADGSIGALFTRKKHRGRGYAQRLVRALCARLREARLPVYCAIVVGNARSESFFKRAGFALAASDGSEQVSWLKLGCCETDTLVGSVVGDEANARRFANAVFVPMCADFIHIGHINILEGAAKYGDVVVLLMTDEAMRGYKRAPKMSFAQRERIIRSFRQVTEVLPCLGPWTYVPMARQHRPGFFYHGDDWKMGPQAAARAAVIEAVEEYGGRVIEPAYTKNVSSTEFQTLFDPAIKARLFPPPPSSSF